jgi:hypothetical protein
MNAVQMAGDFMGLSNLQVIAGVLFVIVLFILIKRRRSKASQ